MAQLKATNNMELWTDKVEAFGSVRRVYFRLLTQDAATGALAWHYFGTTAAEKPPQGAYAGAPVVAHPYVQFPQAFDDLGQDDTDALYSIGVRAGLKREGLA